MRIAKMDKRIDIFEVFRNEGKLATLYAYASQHILEDPYEKNLATSTYLNPLPVKALIRQVSAESLHWKYFGNIPVGSIEVITEKKNLTLLKTADKIKYRDNYFKCYKDDSKGFTIIERDDYIIVILALKEL